jgi:hypothetical protein
MSERKALDSLGRGGALVQMHTRRGPEWFVVPGGPVDRQLAERLQEHPLVRPQPDGLFPGMAQTWRMLTVT